MTTSLTTFYFFILIVKVIHTVRIISLDVPKHVQVGTSAVLTCNYSMGVDELYSVKWYKETAEFYRYVPKDKPPAQAFTLKGVRVNQMASNNHQVVLENVGLETSGQYRCEVSAESPSFKTVVQNKRMIVINPPDDGPTITGGRSKYKIGDIVDVNCSSFRSSPVATLEWQINGEKALNEMLRVYPPSRDKDGLESSILGLEFRVNQTHFVNGGLTLRCVANIHSFYTVSNEKSINSEQRTASSVLGNQDQILNRVENMTTSPPCIFFMLLIVFCFYR